MQLNRVNFVDYDQVATAYIKLMKKSYSLKEASVVDIYKLFNQLQYMDKNTQYVNWG